MLAMGRRIVASAGKQTSIRRSLKLARRSAKTVSRKRAGQVASKKSTAIHGRCPHAGSASERAGMAAEPTRQTHWSQRRNINTQLARLE
jgi:hypothetical protein